MMNVVATADVVRLSECCSVCKFSDLCRTFLIYSFLKRIPFPPILTTRCIIGMKISIAKGTYVSPSPIWMGALTLTHVCVDSSQAVLEHHRSFIPYALV